MGTDCSSTRVTLYDEEEDESNRARMRSARGAEAVTAASSIGMPAARSECPARCTNNSPDTTMVVANSSKDAPSTRAEPLEARGRGDAVRFISDHRQQSLNPLQAPTTNVEQNK